MGNNFTKLCIKKLEQKRFQIVYEDSYKPKFEISKLNYVTRIKDNIQTYYQTHAIPTK